jgi:hypothetical protein
VEPCTPDACSGAADFVAQAGECQKLAKILFAGFFSVSGLATTLRRLGYEAEGRA